MGLITLNDIATLFGLIFGISGFALGILNYLRDTPKIKLELRWDQAVTDNPVYDKCKKWGILLVVNVGRRPAYISHAALKLPKNLEWEYLVIYDAIKGERLAEGDPPKMYVINQDQMNEYKKHWKKIRAQVNDSTGKTWYSKKLKKYPKPSWAF